MEHDAAKSKVEQVLSAISVGNLIAGFKTYAEAARNIFRYRSRFVAHCLTPHPSDKFSISITVYLYGILLSFVLFLAITRLHGSSVSKTYFLFQFLYWQVLLIAVLHLSAKAIRGHGSWRDTATTACYFYGVYLPIGMLLLLPLLLYMPTSSFIHVDVATTAKPAAAFEGHLAWLLSWLVINIIAMAAAFFIALHWLAAAHQTKLRWLLLGVILVFVPVMWIHSHFLAPYVSRGVEFLSDFMQDLI